MNRIYTYDDEFYSTDKEMDDGSVGREYFSTEYILSVLLSRRRKLRQPNTPEEYKSHIIELDLIAKWFGIDLFCADFKNEENGTSQL